MDIPVDVAVNKVTGPPALDMDLPGYKPRWAGHVRQIKFAAEAINEAKRPLLYVGRRWSLPRRPMPCAALARGQIPVTTTLLGLGAMDESDPLSLGMLGMHGSAAANYAVQECDCLIAVGARFDNRVTGNLATFAPHAKIIHIDIEAASIAKSVQVDIPVVGDAKDILIRLLEHVHPVHRKEWLDQISFWREQYRFQCEPAGRLKPQEVIAKIGEMTSHDAIIATGVGQHQMWTAQFYGWRRPRQLLSSGGLGTMGYGCPAAIGSQFGNPGRTVIDIDGDGSFSMTMIEIITAVQYSQPVKFVVLDNGYLGLVRQWQEMFYGRRYCAVDHPCPSFAAIAQSFGAKGITITDRSELADAIATMLKHEGPIVLDARVEPEENVYPIVPVGKSLHEMDLGKLA